MRPAWKKITGRKAAQFLWLGNPVLHSQRGTLKRMCVWSPVCPLYCRSLVIYIVFVFSSCWRWLFSWYFGKPFKTKCFGILPPDEKERFDPTQFQDCIIQGLTETGTDLEAVAKFLDASGAKLDYRRYAETLFDILVAGGMLGKWGNVMYGRLCRIQYMNYLTNLSN